MNKEKLEILNKAIAEGYKNNNEIIVDIKKGEIEIVIKGDKKFDYKNATKEEQLSIDELINKVAVSITPATEWTLTLGQEAQIKIQNGDVKIVVKDSVLGAEEVLDYFSELDLESKKIMELMDEHVKTTDSKRKEAIMKEIVDLEIRKLVK